MRSLATAALPIVLALPAANAQAPTQAGAPGSELSVAVVVPPTLPNVDEAVRVQLESRLSQLLTGTGFAAVPGGSSLVMYPSLVVVDERSIEGLQRRVMLKLDLTLFLKNAADGVLFASTSQPIAGVGPNRNAAIVSAVSSMQGSDPALQRFVSSARGKINDYYARNCERVIGEGKTQAATGDISRAMAVLLSVPRELAACRDKANATAARLYAEYQERECQKQLSRARAEAAANHFVDAIDALRGADATSPCARDEAQLLDEIAREVDRREQRSVKVEVDALVAKRKTEARELDSPAKITTRRLSLAAESSVEWYNRQPRPQFSPDLFRH